MRRRDALAGLAGLPSLSRAATTPPGSVPRQRTLADGIGLNVMFSQGRPLRDLPMLSELGLRWVRDFVPWRLIEPEAGQPNAGPPAWRERLAFYRDHDIGVVAVLALANEAAYPPSAAAPQRHVDPEAFAAHAVAMAGLLQRAGVRFVIELGNEPHNSLLPKLLGGHWSGRPPAPWLDHYVAMVRAAVAAVRAFDPSIRLLAGDDMWVLDHRLIEAGLPRELGGLTVHPYVPGVPEQTVLPTADWMQPHQVADADRSLASAVRRLQAAAQAGLGRTPGIWFTEWGWPVGEQAPRQVDETTQAARLPRAFILAEAAGVEALCWFASHDFGDGRFGLITANGIRRPAFRAMQVLVRELGSWQWQRQVLGTARPTAGLQGHLFGQGEARRLALWNASETPIAVTLDGPLRGVSGIDALGQPVTTASGRTDTSAQAAALRIGALPVYLDGIEPSTGPIDWTRHVRH